MTGTTDPTGGTATGGSGETFNTESALSAAPTPEPASAPAASAGIARNALPPAVERRPPASTPAPSPSPAWPRVVAPDAAGGRARRGRTLATAGIVLVGIVIIGMFAAVFLLLSNTRPGTSSTATGASPTQTVAPTATATPAPSPTADPTATLAPTPTLVPPGGIPQGTVLWHTSGSFSSAALPAVANEAVYVGAQDGTLTAFDAHTGARLWSAQAGGAISTAPAVLDGVVVVAAENISTFEWILVAFRASDGSLAWQLRSTTVGYSAPVAVGGLIIAESATNTAGPATLHAFTPGTGATVWTQELTGAESSISSVRPVLFSDGATVYATENGTLFATRVSDHTVVWSKPVPGASLLGQSGVLYIAGRPPAADSSVADVVAYDSGTGTQLWTHAISSVGLDGMTMIAVGGGGVYVATDSGTLHVLSAATGNELWSFRAPARITPPGALYNGALYFAADGIYALDAATGAPRWHLAGVSGPPVAENAIIYASDLYALKP
jgi:outer membrane protein assembly factor BamB